MLHERRPLHMVSTLHSTMGCKLMLNVAIHGTLAQGSATLDQSLNLDKIQDVVARSLLVSLESMLTGLSLYEHRARDVLYSEASFGSASITRLERLVGAEVTWQRGSNAIKNACCDLWQPKHLLPSCASSLRPLLASLWYSSCLAFA